MSSAISGRTTPATLLWGLAGAAFSASMATLEPNMLEEGIMLHLAQRMQGGEHLYRDLVAFTGPLPFELLSFLFGIFGEEIAVARGVVVALCGLTSAAVFDLATRARAGLLAHVAAAIVSTTSFLMFPLFSIFFYTTVSFHLTLIAAAAAARGLHSDGWAVAAGSLIAAAALCKQSVGALLAVALLIAMFAGSEKPVRLRRVGAVALGGALLAVLTLAIYGLRGDLEPLVHSLVFLPMQLGDTFSAPYMNFWPVGEFSHDIHVNKPLYLPFSYVIRNGVFSDVEWPIVVLTQLLYGLPFIALGATALRALRRDLPGEVWMHTAALVALASNLYPRTDWGHLCFVIAPAAVQLLLLAPASAARAFNVRRCIVAAAVLIPLAYTSIYEAQYLHGKSKDPTLGPRVPLRPVSDTVAQRGPRRVVQFLMNRTAPGEAIFVARSEPLLYFATNTTNPTPFSGVLPGLREEQESKILDGLEDVRFVVMSEIDQPLYTYYRDELPAVQAYLERYFRLPNPFLGRRNESWLVVLERSKDRGPTLIDFFDTRETGRRWIRSESGELVRTREEVPILATRHNRRPLAYHMGPRGAGIDFDIEVPENAVFESAVGFQGMWGRGELFAHQRHSRMAVSIKRDGVFQLLDSFPVFFSERLDYGWMPVAVDLSDYAGEKVTLRLYIMPAGKVNLEALAWWGSPRIAEKRPSAKP